jgi:hypothetical protein
MTPWLSFLTRKVIGIVNKTNIFEYKNKYERDLLLEIVTLNKKPEPIKLETYKYLLSRYKEEYRMLEFHFKLNLEQWKKIDKKALN